MHRTVGFSSMHPSDQSYRPSGAMGCAIGIPYGEDLHFVIIALDIFVEFLAFFYYFMRRIVFFISRSECIAFL